MFSFKLPRVTSAIAATFCLAAASSVANANDRIIGGQPILIDSTPSIVALISTGALETTGSVAMSQFCGGTLINPSWVMTAAHCVIVFDEVLSPDELRIVAGSHDLNNIANDPVGVARVIVHENYDEATDDSDIALLQLTSPAVLASEVAALNTTAVPINEALVTAGWGTRQFNFEDGSFDPTPNLEAVQIRALPAADCNAITGYAGDVTENMLCAGIPEGGADSCQGDSGGPLYRQAADGSLIVAGVTSWGIGCGLAEFPGVYTRVASFNDWIRTNMDGSLDGPVITQTEPDDDALEETDNTDTAGPVSVDVSTNPEDGSTTIVVPSLASLNSSGGSAGIWFSALLAGFVGVRRRRFSK